MSRPSARQWSQWGQDFKNYFSNHGCVVKKIILPLDKELLFNAAMLGPGESAMEVDDKAKSRLCGVEVVFHKKFHGSNVLFLIENDKTLGEAA